MRSLIYFYFHCLLVIYIFSDFIKKIVFLQLINKFKDNEKIPGMNICEVKPFFISKIRKLRDKRANFLKNQKIEPAVYRTQTGNRWRTHAQVLSFNMKP